MVGDEGFGPGVPSSSYSLWGDGPGIQDRDWGPRLWNRDQWDGDQALELGKGDQGQVGKRMNLRKLGLFSFMSS